MVRVMIVIAACIASTLSTGCAVGANYERPKLPAPAQYRFVEAEANAQSLADLPWFQVFDDPALQALIREAIGNNLDLRIAAARVEEMRARAGIVKWWPQWPHTYRAAASSSSR